MYDMHCDICFSKDTSLEAVFALPLIFLVLPTPSEIDTEELVLFSKSLRLELALDPLELEPLPFETRFMLRKRWFDANAPVGEGEIADVVVFEGELEVAGRIALLPNFIWNTVFNTKYMMMVLITITMVAGAMSAQIWSGYSLDVIQQL